MLRLSAAAMYQDIGGDKVCCPAPSPSLPWSADVIKRDGQNILIITNHFMTLSNTTILPSETAEDLKNGLIELTTAIRHPGPIQITTDCSPGFSIQKQKDRQL